MTDKQKAIKKAYDEITAQAAKIYGNDWTYAELMKFQRFTKLEKSMQKSIDAMYKEIRGLIETDLNINYLESATNEYEGLLTSGVKLPSIKKLYDAKAAIQAPFGGVVWYERLGQNADEVLVDLSNTIRSGIYNGVSYSNMTKELNRVFGKKDGKWGDRIINDTIARTETRRVISVGQTDVLDKVPESVGLMKKWVTVKDERVRSSHQSMNGVTIPYDEEFVTPLGSKGKAPMQLKGPNAKADNINCFPGETFVAIPTELEKGYKRYYEGDLITIETAGGIKLSGTPNHPILTDKGWVALKLINAGDNVICGDLRENSVSTNPNIKDKPAVISEVFNFIGVGFAAQRATGAVEQFHGDGFNSEVDIVNMLSELRNECDPSISKPFRKDMLMLSNLRKTVLNSNSSFYSTFYRLNSTKKRLVSFFSKSLFFFKSTLRHPKVHRITSVPLSDSRLIEDSNNNGSATVELFSELLYRKPGMVKVDNVVRVDVCSFNGHVYNLQTKNSFYVASSNIITQGELKYNGIISHNCRCIMRSVIP